MAWALPGRPPHQRHELFSSERPSSSLDNVAIHFSLPHIAPSFSDFIKSTAPLDPLVQALPPTPDQRHASSVCERNLFATSHNAVASRPTNNDRDHRHRRSSASTVSELLRALHSADRKPSLQRTQTYPPRKPSMTSQQYSPRTRSRQGSLSSSYGLNVMATQSESSLTENHNWPSPDEYKSEEFSPTAAVFRISPRTSVCAPLGKCIPAGDPNARVIEPLLPHEHVAKHKEQQRALAIQSQQSLRLDTGFNHSFSSIPNSRTRQSPRYPYMTGFTATGHHTPTTPPAGPSFEGLSLRDSIQSVHDCFVGRTEVTSSVSSAASPLTKCWGVDSPHVSAEAQVQPTHWYNSGGSVGRESPEPDAALKDAGDMSLPCSMPYAMPKVEQQYDATLNEDESATATPSEGSKKSSLISRMRSMRSKGSKDSKASKGSSRTSYGSQKESPGSYRKQVTSDEWSVMQSPVSPTSSPALPPRPATSFATYGSPTEQSPEMKSSGSVNARPSTDIASPADSVDGTKKKSFFRRSPSTLKEKHKRGKSKEEDIYENPLQSPASPISSEATSPSPSAIASATTSPMGGPVFPRAMSVSKPAASVWGRKKDGSVRGVSCPVPGTLTSGRPLERNAKSWLERREEAKKEKQRKALKQKIKVVGKADV